MADIRIKALQPEEWDIFRNIRMRAVTMHPEYFLSNKQDAESRPDEFWKEPLNHPHKKVFVLFDGDKAIGLAGVFQDREDDSGKTAVMAMDFIEPEYRGQGLSALLYKARIDWAVKQPVFKTLKISHREGNTPSKRAMTRHGFQFTKTSRVAFGDGIEDTEYCYELDLEKIREQG